MTIISTLIFLNSNAVNIRRDKSMFYNRSFILNSSYSFIGVLQIIILSYLIINIGLFGGLLQVTSFSLAFQTFLFITAATIIQLTAFYSRKIWDFKFDNPFYKLLYKFVHKNDSFINKIWEQFKITEYSLIVLFIILGGLFLMSCSDVVSIFLSLELQSFGLYFLTAIYKNSEFAVSGALMYFLLGGLASTIVLLGTSLSYSHSGATLLNGHYIITGILDAANYLIIKISSLSNLSDIFLNISLLVMSIGLLFKVPAAPFHNWSPDVYDAIPTIVTTFVAIIAKISILVLLLQLVLFTTNLLFNGNFIWVYSLLISSFLSFIIGSILGLSQPRIKRLFAYSTISHIGFILLAIAINTTESIEAFNFYLFQYTLSNLNAFIILISIGFSLYLFVYEDQKTFEKESAELPERNNSPIQLITELRGYFNINPFLALSMAITLFSFVGIPPLMGFFAKQMVLSSALNQGYTFLSFVAIITSVISASYYLYIVKEIFFEKSSLIINKYFVDKIYKYSLISSFNLKKRADFNYTIYNLSLSSCLSLNVSIITMLTLSFMFASQEWTSMTRITAMVASNK